MENNKSYKIIKKQNEITKVAPQEFQPGDVVFRNVLDNLIIDLIPYKIMNERKWTVCIAYKKYLIVFIKWLNVIDIFTIVLTIFLYILHLFV